MPGVPKPLARELTGGMFWVILASSSRERSTARSRDLLTWTGACWNFSTISRRPVTVIVTLSTESLYPCKSSPPGPSSQVTGRGATIPEIAEGPLGLFCVLRFRRNRAALERLHPDRAIHDLLHEVGEP